MPGLDTFNEAYVVRDTKPMKKKGKMTAAPDSAPTLVTSPASSPAPSLMSTLTPALPLAVHKIKGPGPVQVFALV